MRHLLLLLPLLAVGCPTSEPVVTVVQRCGDLNFDALDGYFGRIRTGNAIDSKYRLHAYSKDGATWVDWVPGGTQAYRMRGTRTGPEAMFLEEAAGDHRVELGLSKECRLTLVDGEGKGPAFRPGPEGPMVLAPFPDLARRDFEPCTERLYLGADAKSAAAANKAPPVAQKVPVIKRSETPIAVFTPRSALPAGCTAQVSLYANGEAESLKQPVDSSGDTISWSLLRSNDFLGLQSLSLRRHAVCEDGERLLGVACAQYEVQ
jgi:hypothetical protein